MRQDQNSAPLRAVLDTNILVSALVFPQGRVGSIWQRAIRREFRLLLSPSLAKELGRTLRERFGWDNEAVFRIIRLLARTGEVVNPRGESPMIARDPDDDAILSCALAGRAHLIVTGDHDLLDLSAYEGIPIVRAVDFLRTLGEETRHQN